MTKSNPLVSFVLLAYNQEKFIREALEGAFSQVYSPLEIILSDDCSKDSTFSIMKDEASKYKGPHSLVVRQSEKNRGLTDHYNCVLSQARGEIIVMAAGDDISLPNRTTNTVEALVNNPGVEFVSFTDIHIDKDGNELNPGGDAFSSKESKETVVSLEDYLDFTPINFSGASRGFRREIYDVFGPLIPTCPTEDTPYILRGLILGDAIVSPLSGIKYRKHDNNLSGPASLPFLSIDEIRKQYLQDTSVAVSSGLVSEARHKLIRYWIERNHNRRYLRNEFSRQNKPAIFFFRFLLFSKSFNFLEKLVMLRDLVMNKFR